MFIMKKKEIDVRNCILIKKKQNNGQIFYSDLKTNLGCVLNEGDLLDGLRERKFFEIKRLNVIDAAGFKNLLVLSSLTIGDCLYNSVSLNLFESNCDNRDQVILIGTVLSFIIEMY